MLDSQLYLTLQAGFEALAASTDDAGLEFWLECCKVQPWKPGLSEQEARDVYSRLFVGGKCRVVVRTGFKGLVDATKPAGNSGRSANFPAVIVREGQEDVRKRFLGGRTCIVDEFTGVLIVASLEQEMRALKEVFYHLIESNIPDLRKNAGWMNLEYQGLGDVQPVDAVEMGLMPELLGNFLAHARYSGTRMKPRVDVLQRLPSAGPYYWRVNASDATDDRGGQGKVAVE